MVAGTEWGGGTGGWEVGGRGRGQAVSRQPQPPLHAQSRCRPVSPPPARTQQVLRGEEDPLPWEGSAAGAVGEAERQGPPGSRGQSDKEKAPLPANLCLI